MSVPEKLPVPEYQIRAATEADLPAVLQMELASFTSPHWTREQFAQALGMAQHSFVRYFFLIAEDADGLFGFAIGLAVLAGRQGFGEIQNIAVAEQLRRRGIGLDLCRSLVSRFVELNLTNVELEVRAGNMAAKSLYARLGFEQTGVRRGYYANPVEDGILMSLKL